MNYIQTLCLSLLVLISNTVWAKPLGGNFSLIDQQGQRFELQQLRGKVVVLFFGFTNCPSVCPDSLAKIKAALQGIPKEEIAAVFVTVDPERDTVERIKAYVAPFDDRFIALTGSASEVQSVLDAYQIRVKNLKKSLTDQDYMLDHTADIYVLDRAGNVVNLVPYGLPIEHLQKIITEQRALSLVPQAVTAVNADLSAWQVSDLKGEPQTLSQFKGKALVINFWASWCPSCRKELPSLNQAQALFKDENIQMLAINIGDQPAAAQQFLADYPIDFTVWLDENATSFKAWLVKGLPTTLLIDKNGTIKARIVGERDWMDEKLLQQIRSLTIE